MSLAMDFTSTMRVFRASRVRSRGRSRGVTRLEVALVAVGLLAVVGGGAALLGGQDAELAALDANRSAERIWEAATAWRSENGAIGCPTVSQLLHDHALDVGVDGQDPWGERFRVVCTGGKLSVCSPGPDRKLGTGDDVSAPRS